MFSVQIISNKIFQYNIIQAQTNCKNMQGTFNTFNLLSSNSFPLYFETFTSNYPNEQLLAILTNQKMVIEKLLENQNILRTKVQSFLKCQTTDTEHNFNDSDSLKQKIHNPLQQKFHKKLNTILVLPEGQCLYKTVNKSKMKVEIISSYPQFEKIRDFQSQQVSENISQQKISDQQKRSSCETKNIIKNYGKSILTFIRKNKCLVKKILEQFNKNQNQFMSQLQNFKGKVNSIKQLKLLWMDEGNPFAKIFRILSNIYLSKHSLKHTFSSRVKNYGIHIKYRKRLSEILENPKQFTSIKYC